MDENKTNNNNESQDLQSIKQTEPQQPEQNQDQKALGNSASVEQNQITSTNMQNPKNGKKLHKMVIIFGGIILVIIIFVVFHYISLIPHPLGKPQVLDILKNKYPNVSSIKSLSNYEGRDSCYENFLCFSDPNTITSYSYNGDVYLNNAKFTLPFHIYADENNKVKSDDSDYIYILATVDQNVDSFVSTVNKIGLEHVESMDELLQGYTISNTEEYKQSTALGYKLEHLYVIKPCDSNHNAVRMCGRTDDGQAVSTLANEKNHLVYYDEKLDKWALVNDYPERVIDWWSSQTTPLPDDTVWSKSPLKPYVND